MMNAKHTQGFSLIELMIVIAIFATLLSLALPTYQDYTVRSKVTEGLSISAGVKAAVADYCQSSPSQSFTSISDLGFTEAIDTQYVAWMDALSLGATCTRPVVGFEITNTGAAVDPIIVLVGNLHEGNMEWECVLLAGDRRHVPATCREASAL